METTKKKTILITGGNGDIAKALIEKLKDKYNILSPDREDLNIINEGDCWEFVCKNNIDILINNAGFIMPREIRDLAMSEVMMEFMVNVIAPFNLCSLVLRKKPEAKIINIGSTSGLKGRAGWGGYCASKAGINSLTETLRAENYDAVIFNPRRTNTKMRAELFPNEDKSTLDTPEQVADQIIKLANI